MTTTNRRLCLATVLGILALAVVTAGCGPESDLRCSDSHEVRKQIDLLENTLLYIKDRKSEMKSKDDLYKEARKAMMLMDQQSGVLATGEFRSVLQNFYCRGNDYCLDREDYKGVSTLSIALRYAASEADRLVESLTRYEEVCKAGPVLRNGQIVQDPCESRVKVGTPLTGHDEAAALREDLGAVIDFFYVYGDPVASVDDLLGRIARIKSNGVAAYLAIACAQNEAFTQWLRPSAAGAEKPQVANGRQLKVNKSLHAPSSPAGKNHDASGRIAI